MTGILGSTASLAIHLLRQVSFSITPNSGAYRNIVPPNFAITTVSTVNNSSGQEAVVTALTFGMGGATVPSWLKAGVAVVIAGTVLTQTTLIAGTFVVQTVSADGKSFTVIVPRSNGLSATWTNQGITTGTATLLIQAQKAIFTTPSSNTGNITITDGVDVNNASQGWSVAIGAGLSYEVDMPTGSKFDLKDWAVQGNGSDTLQIRFV